MENKENDMLVLTPSALLAFLTNIEELKDLDISMQEDADKIEIQIGDGSYILESPESSEVEIDEMAVNEIDDLNEEGYDELADDADVEYLEDVEGDRVNGGIIKELIKTLAVGGLVRLTKGAIMNS